MLKLFLITLLSVLYTDAVDGLKVTDNLYYESDHCTGTPSAFVRKSESDPSPPVPGRCIKTKSGSVDKYSVFNFHNAVQSKDVQGNGVYALFKVYQNPECSENAADNQKIHGYLADGLCHKLPDCTGSFKAKCNGDLTELTVCSDNECSENCVNNSQQQAPLTCSLTSINPQNAGNYTRSKCAVLSVVNLHILFDQNTKVSEL